jgi:hypothetical protein
LSELFYTFNGETLGDKMLADTFQKAKLQKRQQWCEEMDKRLAYYDGTQYDYLEDRLRDQFSVTWEQLRPFFYLNIYRKLIDAMAMVYYEPPTRKLAEGTDEDQELFDQMYEDSLADVYLKTGEAYAATFQTAFQQWRWSSEKDTLVMDIIEPQRFDVVQGLHDPLNMNACRAMIMELQSTTDTTTSEGAEDILRYQYWSAGLDPLDGEGRAFIFNSRGEIEPWPDDFNNADFINPFIDPTTDRPIYPFTKLDWRQPTREFFDTGGDDLVAAVENFDMRLTDLMYGAKMQAFSIPVMIYDANATKDSPPKQITFDPGLLLTIPAMGEATSDFRFETPDPKLQELLDLLVKLVELTGRIKGADPASVKLSGNVPESGFSKMLDRGDAIKARKTRLQYWRAYEQEMARKGMIIWNVMSDGQQFSEAAIEGGIIVDFADVQAELEPDKEIQIDRMRQEDGLISIADRMIKYNPDLSREEALERLAENREANRKAAGRIDLDGMFDKMGEPPEGTEGDEPETGDPAEAVDPATALNGAQVTAMIEVINQVASGEMPRETGIQIIAASFPLSMEDAEAIMGDVGRGFVKSKPPIVADNEEGNDV